MSRQERPDASTGHGAASGAIVGAVTFTADRTYVEGDVSVSAVLECLVFIEPYRWN